MTRSEYVVKGNAAVITNGDGIVDCNSCIKEKSDEAFSVVGTISGIARVPIYMLGAMILTAQLVLETPFFIAAKMGIQVLSAISLVKDETAKKATGFVNHYLEHEVNNIKHLVGNLIDVFFWEVLFPPKDRCSFADACINTMGALVGAVVLKKQPEVELKDAIFICIEELRNRNAQTQEGILRLSGIQRIVDQVDIKHLSSASLSGEVGVHEIASILKKILREIKLLDPILPKLLNIDVSKDTEQVISELQEIFADKNLRDCLEILQELFHFVSEVVDNGETTKMNLSSTVSVFAQNLAEVPQKDMLANMQKLNRLCEVMIEHRAKIFNAAASEFPTLLE